jgi:phosphoribosylamine--glycine ligase
MVAVSDQAGLLKLCRAEKIDLVVVGPEDPLVAGLADTLREAGFRVFGPGKDGAQIEGSKTFAKSLMRRNAVPTASWRSFDSFEQTAEYLESVINFPVVIKADGLAAGKGVVLPQNLDEAMSAARAMLDEGKFGDAGRKVVVEEFMRGEELSTLVLTDCRTIVVLESAQDFKRIFDGDKGPNTGGMGAYSPVPIATEQLMATVTRDILVRMVHAFTRDRIEYRGVLYAGLMATRGGPKVVEFNCRFGDPETQVVLARLKSDLVPLLAATADGKLSDVTELEWDPRAAVCVVMASRGYPESSSKGDAITGLDQAGAIPDVVVFHAGTAQVGDTVVTAGGRVLGVTALGDTVAAAREKAYAAVAKISFPGMQFRTDIALPAATK